VFQLVELSPPFYFGLYYNTVEYHELYPGGSRFLARLSSSIRAVLVPLYDQVDIQKGIIMGMQYATTMAAEPSAELRTQKSNEVDSEGGDVVATVSVAVPKVLSLKRK